MSKSYPTIHSPSRGAFISVFTTSGDPATSNAIHINLFSSKALTEVPGWEYGIKVAYFRPSSNPYYSPLPTLVVIILVPFLLLFRKESPHGVGSIYPLYIEPLIQISFPSNDIIITFTTYASIGHEV